jgi:dihydroxy-acid dehydratase
MQCLCEALGMALPGGGTALAVSAKRLWIAKESGRRIVDLYEKNVNATDIINVRGLMNAVRVLHAIGGSTNAVIHLLAIAYELGVEDRINLDLIESLGRETPCLAAVRPSGPYTMRDFEEAGGVQSVMKQIAFLLDVEALTVTGKTVGDNLEQISASPSAVIRDFNDPVAKEGLVVLRGNLAESAVVRPTVIAPEMMQHRGPAKAFNSQEEALGGLQEGRIVPGDVVIVRYEGPRGGPGLTEVFKVIGYMKALGLEAKCALVTDGKISGFARGPFICQVFPEAAEGGPLAVVKDDDLIEIDIPQRTLNINIGKTELNNRLNAWVRPKGRVTEGILTLYARLANPASKGAGLDLRMR